MFKYIIVMKEKLIVIGDSFAGPCCYANGYEPEDFWCNVIRKQCDSIDVFVNGSPSRDIQSIIDIWIKSIPYLTKKDKLVVIIPYFIRTRLPLDSSEWYNGFDGDNLYMLPEKFYGTDSYQNPMKLEFWGNDYGKDYLKNMLSKQEMVNASKASQLNYIEIIESLLLMSPIDTYVFSWDNMDYKSDKIDDKDILTKKIGEWTTLYDYWTDSNGVYGVDGDFHWDPNMNRLFAYYIIKKFNLPLKKLI